MLFLWQWFVDTAQRNYQGLWIRSFHICSCQKISTNDLQAVTVGPRFKSWWAHPPHAVELVLLGTSFLPVPSVTFAVTTDAKRNQVVHHIVAEPAPGFHVMDFQAFHGTALLAPPAISLEHACPDDCVFFLIEFESGPFLA